MSDFKAPAYRHFCRNTKGGPVPYTQKVSQWANGASLSIMTFGAYVADAKLQRRSADPNVSSYDDEFIY